VTGCAGVRVNERWVLAPYSGGPQGAGWRILLNEKGGKEHAMPCHHALAEALRVYTDAAGIGDDRKGWLFRSNLLPMC
jgi:hypothetical protein